MDERRGTPMWLHHPVESLSYLQKFVRSPENKATGQQAGIINGCYISSQNHSSGLPFPLLCQILSLSSDIAAHDRPNAQP